MLQDVPAVNRLPVFNGYAHGLHFIPTKPMQTARPLLNSDEAHS